jgi:transaldolase/glucose-6-phosphate isomerase
MTNPLVQLLEFGQSWWLDNISRGFTASGALLALIERDGLRGVTSNPTIFEKAIDESSDYDDAIKRLVDARRNPVEMYDELTGADIREGCDVFRPLYDASEGADGYVSIELPPHLAEDTNGSIAEALRLWSTIERPNMMVKVPATAQGIPVVRRLIAEGLNVNITLMFGEQYYERVIEAYFAGLEDRHNKGLPLGHVASVASCFVSRVDTEADKRIAKASERAPDGTKETLRRLLGKTAIANAKRLYACYQRSISSQRFKRLERLGARRQRPLWASTSTKNPAYPDTYYVEALIGPDTVDTMPPATADAFRDHGKPAATLTQGMDEANRALEQLAACGISLQSITDQLLADGLVAFENSYDKLISALGKKVGSLASSSER